MHADRDPDVKILIKWVNSQFFKSLSSLKIISDLTWNQSRSLEFKIYLVIHPTISIKYFVYEFSLLRKNLNPST